MKQLNEKELEAVVGGAAAAEYASLVVFVSGVINKLPAPLATAIINVLNKI
jgi:bacteriocin-like protein